MAMGNFLVFKSHKIEELKKILLIASKLIGTAKFNKAIKKPPI